MKEILEQLNETDLEQITLATDKINQGNKEDVDRNSLITLFKYWKMIWPKYPQDMNCSSCRKAVVKFFNQLINGLTKVNSSG